MWFLQPSSAHPSAALRLQSAMAAPIFAERHVSCLKKLQVEKFDPRRLVPIEWTQWLLAAGLRPSTLSIYGKDPTTMLEILLDGGWMMLPLLFCSIAVVAIIIDRVRAFRAAAVDFTGLRKNVRDLLFAGKTDEAIDACAASSGPVAATRLVGLQRYVRMKAKGRSLQDMETTVTKTMEDYAPKAINGLEKRLNALILISGISPLIGMTGTVTGMIRSFDVMAASAGLDPGAVAGGIAEALITTAAGLIIAIPAVVAYNVFVRRIEDYTMAIESAITDVAEAMEEA